MGALELVSHPLCPYVQRAAIVLTEKRLPFRRTTIDLAHQPAWFSAISPLPLLRVGEAVLFEPAVICDYLDEAQAPRLHPDDPFQRARHRAWIEFGSGMLAVIVAFYHAPDAAAFEHKRTELAAKFTVLDEVLGDGPWFDGARFSIVDATFGPVFRYLDCFDAIADFHLLDAAPKARRWRTALATRPSVQAAVTTDYPALLREFLLSRPSHLGRLGRCGKC